MIIHKSTIRVGTTEGCFRMIMPTLMRQFKEMYNDYDIRGVIGNAEQMFRTSILSVLKNLGKVQIFVNLVICHSAGVCLICIVCRY